MAVVDDCGRCLCLLLSMLVVGVCCLVLDVLRGVHGLGFSVFRVAQH
jgi:hypothetical protein